MLTQTQLAIQECLKNPLFLTNLIFACLATFIQIINTLSALLNASTTSIKHYSLSIAMMICSFIASSTITLQVSVYHLNAVQKTLYSVNDLLCILNSIKTFFTLMWLGCISIHALKKFDKMIPHSNRHKWLMRRLRAIHLIVCLICTSIVTGRSVTRNSMNAMEYDDIVLIGYFIWSFTYDMAITALLFEKESEIRENVLESDFHHFHQNLVDRWNRVR